MVSGTSLDHGRALRLAFTLAIGLSGACGQPVGGISGGSPARPDARPADTRPPAPDSAGPAPMDAGIGQGDDAPPVPPVDAGADLGVDGVGDVAPEAAPDPQVGAQGIRIGLVEGAQSVFIKLGDGNTVVPPAMRNADLIEGRPLFVRVYVFPQEGFVARALLGRLSITPADAGPPSLAALPALEDRKMILGPSNPERLETTFNFLVPAERMKPGAQLWAAIYEADPAGGPPAGSAPAPRFPGTAALDLGVKAGKMELDVVMVPAIGPGGMVDAAPARRKRVEDHLYDVYPVQKVNVRWREPLRFTARASASVGFRALVDARTSDGAPPGTYYHLLLATEDSTERFLGIANLAGATAADGPRRIGITFVTGRRVDSLLDTISHEMGHNHGRNHAPGCGAQGVDGGFPYPGSGARPAPGIGVNGYSLSSATLQVARTTHELMGYCNVTWVSDYTWMGFARRVRAVSALPGAGAMALYSDGAALPGADGQSLLGFLSPGEPPQWTLVEGQLADRAASGAATVTLASGATVPAALSVQTLSDDHTREIAVNLPRQAGARQVDLVLDGRPHTVDLERLAR